MIYRVSAHFKELFKMKILVIVDMQNDFINGALGTPEAQAVVGDVAKKISGFDGDLICITKDTHRSADYLKTQEGQLLPVEHCIEGTHGWRLDDIIATAISHAAIDAGKSVSVFQKGTFGSVELGDYLVELSARMKQRIEEIVFVGLCTDICVISNALLVKAFLPETKITVDAACCAGDFSPLANLMVHEVIQIGYELLLPINLISKIPSDGLCGKTDEDNLGFTYAHLDAYIMYGTSGIEEIDKKITSMHDHNLHKLNPMPAYGTTIF